jgi:hypothetical protein
MQALVQPAPGSGLVTTTLLTLSPKERRLFARFS